MTVDLDRNIGFAYSTHSSGTLTIHVGSLLNLDTGVTREALPQKAGESGETRLTRRVVISDNSQEFICDPFARDIFHLLLSLSSIYLFLAESIIVLST